MESDEFFRIVRAEYPHFLRFAADQFPQSRLVLRAGFCVALQYSLQQAQCRRAAWVHCAHFPVVKIGVATMQQPGGFAPHCHAAVSAAMAVQRDECNIRYVRRKHTHALKAEPAVAAGLVTRPVRVRRPLFLDITVPFHKSPGVHCRLIFPLEYVDLCVGKVGEPACMVNVKVCEHHMTDIRHTVS